MIAAAQCSPTAPAKEEVNPYECGYGDGVDVGVPDDDRMGDVLDRGQYLVEQEALRIQREEERAADEHILRERGKERYQSDHYNIM